LARRYWAHSLLLSDHRRYFPNLGGLLPGRGVGRAKKRHGDESITIQSQAGNNGCYTAQIMKWILFVMLVASAALAQNPERSGPAQPTAQGDPYARQSAQRRQGSEALSREQARSKQDLCAEAGKGGNAEIGQCLDEQFKTTEQDYVAYARSPDESASTSHRRLPFDSAEDAWLKYRDASCASMATQWEGTQSGVAYADCRLKLTWNHMNELADLYSDLWH
jgi:uncharacterized protein YecT (DUF1311 family)